MARALCWTGRLEEARLLFEALPLEYDPGNIPGYLALIAAAQERVDEARSILERVAAFRSSPEDRYWGVLWQARIAAGLGERDCAGNDVPDDAHGRAWELCA